MRGRREGERGPQARTSDLPRRDVGSHGEARRAARSRPLPARGLPPDRGGSLRTTLSSAGKLLGQPRQRLPLSVTEEIHPPTQSISSPRGPAVQPA
eukprot:scaffold257146_cov13-Tisochrysis_lutea.AAC.1